MTEPNSDQSQLSQPALVRLLVSEQVKVLAYIHSLVRDEHLCEDVFQELCVLAVEKAASIRDEAHLLKWMRTTARFLSLQALQTRERRNRSLDEAVIAMLEPSWKDRDGDNSADWHDALRHCVDLLPKRAKALVEKRYTAEHTYEQISAETGRPVSSLYVTFSRIFNSLRYCISANLRTSDGGSGGR
jgi:RNA polymerase sigma factor (sigma-70 family)